MDHLDFYSGRDAARVIKDIAAHRKGKSSAQRDGKAAGK
jgi:hypothetical protein